MSLPIEDRYEVAILIVGGALYVVIGAYMALRAARWPMIAFAMLAKTRRRAISYQTAKTVRFVRILGICFATLAVLMIYTGAQHYRWIKTIELYDATHPETQ